MRVLRAIVNIGSTIGVPALFWIWYYWTVRVEPAPQFLKSGIMALALLVTFFSAFLALVSLPRMQTAFVAGSKPLQLMLRSLSWLFVFAFAVLALYFLNIYFRLKGMISVP